jgi:fructose-1,6-bisphosphatase/inositol monophosphatase family enzyme
MKDLASLLAPLRSLHETIRQTVVDACEQSSLEQLSAVVADESGDTIFAIDRVSEELLLDFFEKEVALVTPIVLIAEGLSNGKVVLPRGAKEAEAVWRIIVDPIDGTRGLMYQKRSAWILTGVAPNRGNDTRLSDIEFAIQTEIPLAKQHLSDVLWAFRGEGVNAERYDRIKSETTPITLKPSTASSIEQGFAMIARFFPGVRDVLAEIDEEIIRNALGKPREGKAQCFEDQYISTGGQLYELMAGHDRFIADIRPLMRCEMEKRGVDLSICCHPYDLCTELIAREMGVIVTNEHGLALDAPLNVEMDVAWAGYANDRIRAQIEPLLQNALKKRGMLDSLP